MPPERAAGGERSRGGRPRRQPRRVPYQALLRPRPATLPPPPHGRPDPAIAMSNHHPVPSTAPAPPPVGQSSPPSLIPLLYPNTHELTIIAERGGIKGHVAAMDSTLPASFITQRTADVLNLPQGICEGKIMRTPLGVRSCEKVAAFPAVLPMLDPLDASRIPVPVRTYILAAGDHILPIVLGAPFLQDMMDGIHGDNTIHPRMFAPPEPDMTLRHIMLQAIPTPNVYPDYLRSSSAPSAPPLLAEHVTMLSAPAWETPTTSSAHPPPENTFIIGDPQEEEWSHQYGTMLSPPMWGTQSTSSTYLPPRNMFIVSDPQEEE
ncbi:hypothetical protein QBC39DRAFT_97914 [Podospora conica]|nr:hypothetical protein QBC39DRAFT_97914 [Schizothecium conicum]